MTIDRKTTKPFHVFNFVTSIKPLLILDFEFYHFVFPKSRKKFNRQISDPFLALVEKIQPLAIFLFTEVAIFYGQRVQFALVPFMFYGKNTLSSRAKALVFELLENTVFPPIRSVLFDVL